MFGLTVLCASISLNLFTQRCKLHDGLDRNDLFPALNMREDMITKWISAVRGK